jgi:hypothetical protein
MRVKTAMQKLGSVSIQVIQRQVPARRFGAGGASKAKK